MSRLVTFMGIDPGTNNTGISILKYDYETRDIGSVDALTIDGSKTYDIASEDLMYSHGDRFHRIYSIAAVAQRLMKHHEPLEIACESPFYHRLHPGSFAPLLEVVYAMRMAAIRFNPHVRFITYEPLLVKKTLSGKAFADKHQMKEALKNNETISSKLITPLEEMTEHAIDAIGIAYTHYIHLR